MDKIHLCGMIARHLSARILADLDIFPIVAIIGPRQAGKTTLAKSLVSTLQKPAIYLDLESENDQAKLASPETHLAGLADRCVIIDEIQLQPRLFPLLRSLVDRQREPARFLLLGSASPELLRQSSESLAGRIAYHELTPFMLTEVPPAGTMREHWLRGGFPEAFLAKDWPVSRRWLENFTKTFIERDLRRVIGYEVDAAAMGRFVRMLGHLHGHILNVADLSRSMDISVQSVNKYLNLLDGSFLTTRLEPWFINIGKRLTKAPKFYFRDSGFFHALARVPDADGLLASPFVGASWEGYVIEQIRREAGPDFHLFYFRTHNGAEVDLILETPDGKIAAIEIKFSNAPSISKGFFQACLDLGPDFKFVVTPESAAFTRDPEITVCSLAYFIKEVLPKMA